METVEIGLNLPLHSSYELPTICTCTPSPYPSSHTHKHTHTGYWVSFTDNLQRVLLFTPFKEVAERALRGSEPARPHLSVSLSLQAVGLSLVDDEKGQEVAYICLPQ